MSGVGLCCVRMEFACHLRASVSDACLSTNVFLSVSVHVSLAVENRGHAGYRGGEQLWQGIENSPGWGKKEQPGLLLPRTGNGKRAEDRGDFMLSVSITTLCFSWDVLPSLRGLINLPRSPEQPPQSEFACLSAEVAIAIWNSNSVSQEINLSV